MLGWSAERSNTVEMAQKRRDVDFFLVSVVREHGNNKKKLATKMQSKQHYCNFYSSFEKLLNDLFSDAMQASIAICEKVGTAAN